MGRIPEKYEHRQIFKLFSQRLCKIFAAMDQKYDEAASHYGFSCEGCRGNCCRSLFFHHTFLEYLYLQEGYHTLGAQKRAEVKNRARAICNESQKAAGKDGGVHPMCPLNFEGRCDLYPYRPMICRLHGLPHELQRPDKRIVMGAGCEIFIQKHAKKNYFKFDRTPFYLELAVWEEDFKNKTGLTHKLKVTIAEIIASF